MRFHIIIQIFLSILFVFVTNTFASQNLNISNVIVNNALIDTRKGESAQISFYLHQDTHISLSIKDMDGQNIASIQKNCYKGTNTIFWDGIDDAGHPVADEAYYFILKATGLNGLVTLYDPASCSKMEKINIVPQINADKIAYTLTKDAYVRIRIGIHNGPLLKTLLDCEPRKAGNYSETWDTKDESRIIDLNQTDYIVNIQAYTLPENSIITTGIGMSLLDYKISSTNKSSLPGQHYNLSLIDRKRIFSGQSNYSILSLRTMNRAPRFDIHVKANPIRSKQTVSGLIPITIDLEEMTGLILSNQRYEIIAYVDYEFLMEDEQGYHPYTFNLDTRNLTNGDHILTFNVATLTDQVGSGSIKINVQNN